MRFAPLVLSVILAACAAAPERPRAGIVDDFGDTVAVGRAPGRIVSLNPTTTEILFAIGAGPRLVGRTRWDLWPDSARLVPDLGDGLRPNVEAVLAARPDIVVLYASNDNRPAAERLRAAGVETYAVKVDRIEDFARVVEQLGRITGDTARARLTRDTVLRAVDSVRAATAGRTPVRVVWHVWDDPLIVIGGGSYMSELLAAAGGRNVYGDAANPSPQVSLEDVLRRDPDAVLTSAASAPRIRSDAGWRAARAVREGRVLVVDTALVGRPSVRLGEAARSLARLLHPEAPAP